jgi:tRNA A-37 threonylcarbamoyl transferase component Bud32
VVIKATTVEKQHRLQAEANNYRHLRSLQGNQIPVCLGSFQPRVPYWYHGELMAEMMVLSWSGTRLQHIINDENSSFFNQERKKALTVLRSHGVVHNDSEWRNMLWDELSGQLIVIDLEDVKLLKRRRVLESTSGNTWRGHRVGAGKASKSSCLARQLRAFDDRQTTDHRVSRLG